MEKGNEKPNNKKKFKTFRAATHILKREALRRYREKLEKQSNQDNNLETGNEYFDRSSTYPSYESKAKSINEDIQSANGESSSIDAKNATIDSESNSFLSLTEKLNQLQHGGEKEFSVLIKGSVGPTQDNESVNQYQILSHMDPEENNQEAIDNQSSNEVQSEPAGIALSDEHRDDSQEPESIKEDVKELNEGLKTQGDNDIAKKNQNDQDIVREDQENQDEVNQSNLGNEELGSLDDAQPNEKVDNVQEDVTKENQDEVNQSNLGSEELGSLDGAQPNEQVDNVQEDVTKENQDEVNQSNLGNEELGSLDGAQPNEQVDNVQGNVTKENQDEINQSNLGSKELGSFDGTEPNEQVDNAQDDVTHTNLNEQEVDNKEDAIELADKTGDLKQEPSIEQGIDEQSADESVLVDQEVDVSDKDENKKKTVDDKETDETASGITNVAEPNGENEVAKDNAVENVNEIGAIEQTDETAINQIEETTIDQVEETNIEQVDETTNEQVDDTTTDQVDEITIDQTDENTIDQTKEFNIGQEGKITEEEKIEQTAGEEKVDSADAEDLNTTSDLVQDTSQKDKQEEIIESIETSQKEPVESEEPEVVISYNAEDYQSIPRISEESGIPLNILQFYHSFGYDCQKRSNLYLLKGPTALFAAGNYIHLLDLLKDEHIFLRTAGGGGIGALAVHPSGEYFAVAEKKDKPGIYIYGYPSLSLHRILRGGTEQAYSFIDFSPKGDLLASVGSSPDYMLTLWDWNKENIMLRSKAFSQEVYRVTFSPEQEGQLTSCGTTHIRFWKMARTFTGLKLKGELGRFGKTALGDIEGYVQLPDGKVLSGSEWGNMLLWDGGLIKVEISRKNQKFCHVGSIQQLVMDEGELITIGRDGYVRVWEMEAIDTADITDESDIFELEPMNELRVGADVQLTCMVKATQDEEGEDVTSIWYAQDANGGIWKLDLSFSHTTKPPEKMYSYTAGGITGLCCSPLSHLFVTSGDAYVRLYDYLTKKPVCHYITPTPQTTSTCVLWPNQVVDSKCSTILAGFSDGIVRVLTLQQVDSTNQLKLKQAMKPHLSEVTAMAIDNNGQILATGSNDNTVFFFSVDSDNYLPIGFVKVPGEVTGLQWSPVGFATSTLLVACHNGNVVEIDSPSQTAFDTSHSFHLQDVKMKNFLFQSVKSELRRNEERERKAKAKAERRAKREKELKRRQDAGEEISPEDAQTFLNEDPEAEEEEEEEPLFYPPEPNSILQAFYLKSGTFVVSVGGYDAGYLYECQFPDQSPSDDITSTKPINAVPVEGCDDVAITRIIFADSGRKVIAGFENGMIRAYPLNLDEDVEFSPDMLSSYWEFNMHDNNAGAITNLCSSHDHAYLFSGGNDGNIFAYTSLSHEEIVKSMEGKRAKLPSPKKFATEEAVIDDIDDVHAYSIEEAKLKAEHDKMVKDAEAKKALERKKIAKLRKTFIELKRKNLELPESVQLKKEEFELDPTLRENMQKETADRIQQVKLEMQWNKAKLELAHEKLKQRFRAQIECERIVVHSFQSDHSIPSYRMNKQSNTFTKLLDSVNESIRANSITSDTGTVNINEKGTVVSDRSHEDRTNEELESHLDEAAYLQDATQKQKSSILHGRQAEKVQKALQKAAEAREKRDKRQQEWLELYRNQPDENYEDPADVAAISEAQANMGDFKLKTSPDYFVPEHLRMDTEKKRFQILTLQSLSHRLKASHNEKLIKLRDEKFLIIQEIENYVAEVKKLQNKLPEEDRVPIPPVPTIHPEEQPYKKFEYTKESLLKFEEDEKRREVDAAASMRKGDGGLFGGFGGGDSSVTESMAEIKLSHSRNLRRTPSVASSTRSKSSKFKLIEQEHVLPSHLETQLSHIEKIRCIYHRNRLLDLIKQKTILFDAELRWLRHNKGKLDVDLKLADLREVTLIEELLLLKEYEKREKTLSGRVAAKKAELADILGKAADMQVKLESKRRDIDRLSDRERALYSSFANSIGENNKFADFLNKVFKKKIKRAKKKIAAEGEEGDSDESDSDESEFSSDEDEDESDEGGFDDSVCPPGCDLQLFDSAITLREKRLDLEEALAEEKKTAEAFKKDADSYVKKSKIMESQLKMALADLEAFQVEKQGKLNELDVVVPLRLHQVEHVYNGVVPNDLSPCLVFTNSSLTGLQRRIKELQQEKHEQRKLYKESRYQHVHLIKNRRVMERKIKELEEKCEGMMMLKFGRVVDLDKLDCVTINRTVEELKEKIRRSEMRNSSELSKRQRLIDHLRDQMMILIQENTKRLETLKVLVSDKDNLEQSLEKRQKTMELDDPTLRKKAEMREQHRLVQLVQLQGQEIQALKEEIGLLSRKGGHILPPAQPPLGQEQEII